VALGKVALLSVLLPFALVVGKVALLSVLLPFALVVVEVQILNLTRKSHFRNPLVCMIA